MKRVAMHHRGRSRWAMMSPVAGTLALALTPTAARAELDGTQPDTSFVQYLGAGGAAIDAPLGVAVDVRAGEIVLANTGGRRIEIYDMSLRPRGSFAHPVPDTSGEIHEGQPKHVAVDAESRLYISDVTVPWVDVCDFRGHSLTHLTLPAPDDRLTTGGAGPIAIAADGRIYVASRRDRPRIYVFGPDHRLERSWGEAGTAPGQLHSITALAVGPDSNVVVTCARTERAVQVFDAQGRYLRGFGVHDIGPGNFSQPTGVVVTPDGRIWVVDSIRANLQVFDPAGTLVGATGGGEGPGAWLYPSALASDGHGWFAVAEMGGSRLRLLHIR
ncbi:MAG: NHL repeat-containing protein [Candidatus Eisenbacteria bacterium]